MPQWHCGGVVDHTMDASDGRWLLLATALNLAVGDNGSSGGRASIEGFEWGVPTPEEETLERFDQRWSYGS